MASINLGVKDLAECPVCCSTDGVPKRLPCDHTCCANCLQIMLDKYREVSAHSDQPSPKDAILCPLCRCMVNIPNGNVESLPTHLLMKQLQYVVNNVVPNVTEEKIGCKLCMSDTAMMYCRNCKLLACTPCADQHQKNGLFSGHTIVPRTLIFCAEHENQFTCFCTDCNRFLCVMCINNGVCEDHVVEALSALEVKKTKELEGLVSRMTSMMSQKVSRGHERDIAKRADEVKEEIRCHSAQLMAKLMVQEQTLLDEVDLWKKGGRYKKTDPSVKRRRTMLEEMVSMALGAKQMGVEKMVLILPIIKARFSTVSKTLQKDTLKENISFQAVDGLELGSLDIGKAEIPGVVLGQPAACAFPKGKIKHSHKKEMSSTEGRVTDKSVPDIKYVLYKNMWQNERFTYGPAIVSTPGGCLVLCDYKAKTVFMLDSDFKVVCSTNVRELDLEAEPCGLAYNCGQSAIVVTFGRKGIVMLNDSNLSLIRHVNLQGAPVAPRALDVSILSNQNIVVTTTDPGSVNIYNSAGIMLKQIREYNVGKLQEKIKVHHPTYILVLPDDTIVVSMFGSKQVVYFTPEGDCIRAYTLNMFPLQTNISLPGGTPRGICVDDDGILVASWSGQGCIVKLRLDGGALCEDLVLEISKLQREECGNLQSLTKLGGSLVLMFEKCITLYKVQHPKTVSWADST